MKINLFTLSFAFLVWGCANNEQLSDSESQETDALKSEDLAKVQLRGDLVYLQNTESPFTGKAQAEYPDGQIRAIAQFEGGELKGLKRWWPNGATELELEFKKGEVVASDIELYESSSSFVLVPPPAILNLKSVERDSHLTGLILKHTQGLNSPELRAQVLSRLDQPEYKMVLLAPFAMEGIRMELGSSYSYGIEVGGSTNRPRFVITARARSARGAMIVADLVQHEYEKLHGTERGQKAEFVKQTLENLLENSLAKERAIASEMAAFKKETELVLEEDEKRATGGRRHRLSEEITKVRVEQIRITSLLRQILAINARIDPRPESVSSKDLNDDIATLKEFFEIDAIEAFGNVPALRKSLYELERARKDYHETEPAYLEKHPKMLENAKSIHRVKNSLMAEIASAIENHKDKLKQLTQTEAEFLNELENVQKESMLIDKTQEMLKKHERELAKVRTSTDSIQIRLNQINVEQALPNAEDEPLRKERMAVLPSSPIPLSRPRVEDALLGTGMVKGNMPWQPDGSFTEFYENGKKKTEGTFRKGKKSGLWVSYDQDGKEINRKSFQGG